MLTDALTKSAIMPEDAVEFEDLFLAHYNGVYRLIFGIVGERQEAEDLAQETFLRLYHHHFSPDRDHNIRAWLYRVATNLAYNAVRNRGRRERHQQASLQTERSPVNPAEAAIRADERDTVRQVLATLSDQQRQILLMRHAGLSYKELAQALGVAPGSVGTLLSRAHKAFEEQYQAMAVKAMVIDQVGGTS